MECTNFSSEIDEILMSTLSKHWTLILEEKCPVELNRITPYIYVNIVFLKIGWNSVLRGKVVKIIQKLHINKFAITTFNINSQKWFKIKKETLNE